MGCELVAPTDRKLITSEKSPTTRKYTDSDIQNFLIH
jgi:hypothetical protein